MSSAPRVSHPDKATELEATSSSEPLAGAVAADRSTVAVDELALDATASSPMEFSIQRGVILGGRFRVTKLVGAGAQCFVFAAEHTTLKNQVAIKCLKPEVTTPDLVDRFAREAQALTAIRNAHVAAVLDVGRAPCGTPYIVMEYLHGRDLGELLHSRPRLEPRQATEIALQTCEGLAAAHALGLVHQDIKPSNIFLSDEMGLVKAKVVDFGVARVSMGATPSDRPRFTRSKLDETVGGTPFYMPPEQFYVDSMIDPRSDIFSLGMVLYEMLRGTTAFDAEMSKRRQGAPVHIDRSGIDPGLADVIERCLAQEPAGRFETVAELAVALLPYAPSRSRSHVEAAGALLRKAGLSVRATLNSSMPPPMGSKLPTVSIPPAAPLPTFSPPRSSRAPLYTALGVLAIVVLGLGLWRLSVARETSAARSVADTPTSASRPEAAPVLGLTTAQRATGAAPIESATQADAASAPSAGRGPRKPGTKSGAPRATASAAASSAPEPKSTGTSEDLGF